MPAGDRSVTAEIRIEARRPFPFLTEPDRIRWKEVEAHVEATPGGAYRVHVTRRDMAVGGGGRSRTGSVGRRNDGHELIDGSRALGLRREGREPPTSVGR